jgi:hypothetical protein
MTSRFIGTPYKQFHDTGPVNPVFRPMDIPLIACAQISSPHLMRKMCRVLY